MIEIPPAVGDKPENRIEITLDGDTWDVPKAKYMTVAEGEGFDYDADVQIAFLSGHNEERAAKIRKLEQHQYKALRDGFLKDSGLKVGDSEASSS